MGGRLPHASGARSGNREKKLEDAGGVFDAMVARKREDIDGDRLSEASIDAALSRGNPEIAALLRELAQGMPTLVEEGYIATGRDGAAQGPEGDEEESRNGRREAHPRQLHQQGPRIRHAS